MDVPARHSQQRSQLHHKQPPFLHTESFHMHAFHMLHQQTLQLQLNCLPAFSGEPIPHIQYTDSEQVVWATALRELKKLFPQHACKEYLRSYPLFDFRWGPPTQLHTCKCSAAMRACHRPCTLSRAASRLSQQTCERPAHAAPPASACLEHLELWSDACDIRTQLQPCCACKAAEAAATCCCALCIVHQDHAGATALTGCTCTWRAL